MISEKVVSYYDGNEVCEAFVAFPSSKKAQTPCVMVAHDWSGRNDFACDKARQLAELGFVGFAIDMYGHGKSTEDNDQKSAWMMPFLNNRKALLNRINAAFQAAKHLSEVDDTKIAIMGFCFGGLCALDLARSGADIKGTISFHGLLNAPKQSHAARIKAKVLVLHGYDDPMCKPEQIDIFAKEMTSRKVDWQLHAYGNTQHAFTNPKANDPNKGLRYDVVAKDRSWQSALNFLNEIFSQS